MRNELRARCHSRNTEYDKELTEFERKYIRMYILKASIYTVRKTIKCKNITVELQAPYF